MEVPDKGARDASSRRSTPACASVDEDTPNDEGRLGAFQAIIGEMMPSKRPSSRAWILSPWYRYRRFELAKGALSDPVRPDLILLHIYRVGWFWMTAVPLLFGLLGGIAYVLHHADNEPAARIAIAAGVGVGAAGIVAGLDAVWRYLYARTACHRYETGGRTLVSEPEWVLRPLRTALRNDGIVLIMIVVGIFVFASVAARP
jgi:hypothetical protein